MDDNLLQFGLRAFVTLFVVVDPLGVAPNFVALTSEFGTIERNQTSAGAVIISFGVTLLLPRVRTVIARLSRRHGACLHHQGLASCRKIPLSDQELP